MSNSIIEIKNLTADLIIITDLIDCAIAPGATHNVSDKNSYGDSEIATTKC